LARHCCRVCSAARARRAPAGEGGCRVTPLQAWWQAQLDLLDEARTALDEQTWALFVRLWTIRAAAENARFLDLEERAA